LNVPSGGSESTSSVLYVLARGSSTTPRHAATWFDYVTTDPDRLTLSWGLAAAHHGASLANYVDAATVGLEGGRAIGVHAIDRLSGRTLEIAGRVVINATGGAVDRLLGASGLTSGVPMLKAMNLVTSRNAPDLALGGRGPT